MTSSAAALRRHRRPGIALPWWALTGGAFAALGASAAVLVAVLGFWALLVPLYAALLGLAIFAPRKSALLLLFLGLAFEPAAIDQTKPISVALFEMAPALEGIFPVTISPFELFLTFTAISFAFRKNTAQGLQPLPMLVWAIPIVMAAGLAYGLSQGGDSTLAYHEMRGLIYSSLAFIIARKMMGVDGWTVARVAMLASTTLALIVTVRYQVYIKDGNSPVPVEAAFAHEDAVFLGLAFVAGCLLMIRTQKPRRRWLFLLHNLIVLFALLATGRRAGTLVLIVGMLFTFAFLLPRKPALVLMASLPLFVLGALYLGAYWNKTYGAAAQPARAVRSQIDPDARDDSSDQYRVNERFNVEQTLYLGEIFGVGFGRPFVSFYPLPDLTSFWPLQNYTPHQNILWLWLKMGIVGISAFLTLWVLALRQCFLNMRGFARAPVLPVVPMITAAGLACYLAYGKVDLAFVSTRSCGLLAVLMAVALSLKAAESLHKKAIDE
ncbi:MAG: O-antigen ligase family protein [Dehalococcoidia bacterium]